jgi:hypothetical protein
MLRVDRDRGLVLTFRAGQVAALLMGQGSREQIVRRLGVDCGYRQEQA